MNDLSSLEPGFRPALRAILNHTTHLIGSAALTPEQTVDVSLIGESARNLIDLLDHAPKARDQMQIAAEFRTPLNAILGFSTTLMQFPTLYDGAQLDDEHHQRVFQIYEIGWGLLNQLYTHFDFA